MQRWFWVAAGVLGLVACDHDPARGGAGESCTARDDCGDGLACIAQVCTQPVQRSAASAGAEPAAEGGTCRARRDCQADLICLDNSCQRPSAGTAADARFSSRGESCQAKNDCAPELACVMSTCRPLDIALERTAKSCHRVECSEREDCCRNFVPSPNCPEYKKNCDDDPVFCNSYHQLCECSKDCVEALCVDAKPSCSSNAECTSQQNPFCVEGGCVQCQEDSNCQGQGTRCNHGICVAACTVDENCPMLHACQDGVCVETGCKSDRECVFLMRDALAVCQDTKCQVPCQADADCPSPANTLSFQVCEQGQCVFVGCETDSECRALLGLQNMDNATRAVCKADD